MKFVSYPDRDILAMDVADLIASELESSLFHEERTTFAVPGGSTPGPVFDVMSGVSRVDWSRVDVLPTDERWVPVDSPRSNTALLRARLLSGPAAAARLVPVYAEGPIAKVVPALAREIEPLFPISVLMLGMGADMHTASLFPGAPGLAAALAPDAPALNIVEPEDAQEIRVTLPAHALEGALSKHLVITGADKRAAFERAVTLAPQEAPIAAVMTDLIVHWAD